MASAMGNWPSAKKQTPADVLASTSFGISIYFALPTECQIDWIGSTIYLLFSDETFCWNIIIYYYYFLSFWKVEIETKVYGTKFWWFYFIAVLTLRNVLNSFCYVRQYLLPSGSSDFKLVLQATALVAISLCMWIWSINKKNKCLLLGILCSGLCSQRTLVPWLLVLDQQCRLQKCGISFIWVGLNLEIQLQCTLNIVGCKTGGSNTAKTN